MRKDVIDNIIQTQTKAWEQLMQWYEHQIGPAPEFPNDQDPPRIPTDKILKALLVNTLPRFLYEFFDQFKVKIFLMEEGTAQWGYLIRIPEQYDLTYQHPGFESRIAAEEEAFRSAFKLMEEVIIPNANVND